VYDLGAWRDAKAAESRAKAEVKRRQAAITAALGEAEEGLVAGERAVTWRQQSRTDRCPDPGCGCGAEKVSTFRVLRDAAKRGGDA
jgi:hypothetical protein